MGDRERNRVRLRIATLIAAAIPIAMLAGLVVMLVR